MTNDETKKQSNSATVQTLKQNYLYMIETKKPESTAKATHKSPTIQQEKKLNALIKTVHVNNNNHNNANNLIKSNKSNSVESIPSLLSYKINDFNKKLLKKNGNFKADSNNDNCLTANINSKDLTQQNNNHYNINNNNNNNNDNLPLTNIVNRQRTVNRSFRTAVDKSLDVPSIGKHFSFSLLFTRFDTYSRLMTCTIDTLFV
jgi:hypothetical protein